MNKIIMLLLFVMPCHGTFAQSEQARPLSDLINKQDPAWTFIKQWIAGAKNLVEVLPKDNARADTALFDAQVTTHSTMGAVVYETGGIFIDNGWIRILGSGSKRLNRTLMGWNKGKSYTSSIGTGLGFLLIADDVLGGFFALNAGGIDTGGIGKVFYFAPDERNWDKTEMNYTSFLSFCFSGNIELFYKDFRWINWKKDVALLDGNEAISFFPFLWSKEGQQDINKDERKTMPIQELWDLYFKKK